MSERTELENMQEDANVSENKAPLATIRTSCKDCVFAVYVNNKQIDCQLNRINKYKETGVVTTTLDIESGLTHYIIENKICHACRHKESEWSLKTPSESYVNLIKIELRPKVEFFIGTLDKSIEELRSTLQSIREQTYPPHCVTVLNCGKPSSFECRSIIHEVGGDYPWKVVTCLEDRRAIDDSLRNSDSTDYCWVEAGTVLPGNFLERLDQLVNEELKQVAMIDGDIRVVSTNIHTFLGGNTHVIDIEQNDVVTTIEEKIRRLLVQQGKLHMLLQYNELFS